MLQFLSRLHGRLLRLSTLHHLTPRSVTNQLADAFELAAKGSPISIRSPRITPALEKDCVP
jgi:hypothetical protein